MKRFFLSDRKVLNAILRVQLKYMKDVSFSWNEMLFAMQKTDFHVLELFCRASHVRASMHRITSLELLSTLMICLVQLSKWRMQGQGCWKASFHERKLLTSFFCRASNVRASMHRITGLDLLRTLMLCLVQLSKWREWKATDAEKVLSQWEKGAKCNFKSTAQVHERCFFLWNEMLFAMQKTDFHVLELFCRASHVRASMHRITSLELLRTLMMCLVQLSKWRECKAKDAEKLLSQWEKVAKCNFKSKAQVHEICFFLMKWNVICNVEDRFLMFRAFLQSKSC